MKKKILTLIIFLLLDSCFATTINPNVTFEPLTRQIEPHKSKDTEFRMCKHLADVKQLSGDARSAFIATCVKNN